MTTADRPHYRRPGLLTRRVMNPLIAGLTRIGLPVVGSRVLEVPGRRSGEPRRVPVNLLDLDGVEHLVAARGETEWVRNVRAAGGHMTLRAGRRTVARQAIEVPDADKVPILRAYLRRWAFEVGAFFDGVDADSDDDALLAIAPDHPVFRLTAA